MRFQVLDSRCPWCDRPNNGHLQDEAERGAHATPEPGGSTICLHCMEWGIFEAGPFGLTKRRATAAEVTEIETEYPEIVGQARELRNMLGIMGGKQ